MFGKLLSIIRGLKLKRRRLKRVHLFYHLLVFDRTTGHLVGNVVDVSVQGLKLMGKEALTVDEVYELKMALPKTKPEIGTREIEFDVSCIWCNKGYSDFYDSGFELRNIEMKDTQLIRSLSEQFGYIA
ncbi:PilZ domain-containing protein [Desulfococcaceae bacterium HSG9]|nr:PilZ domain-containing protein [Desulfococcaceae bacterium HSG9]